MIGGDVVSPVTVLYDNLGSPIPLSLDAFQRLRVAEPFTLFDSKQVYDSQPLYWTTSTNATGSVTYSNQRASSSLAVSANNDSAIRQTKRYFSYQPGKSFLVMATFVCTGGGQSGVTKRLGYFDPSNGIYFELAGTTLNFVVRSNVSGGIINTIVPRSSWIDPLDGSGPSGKTLDISKAQIFFLDFEWLGVGSIRIGFIIDGQFVIAHRFLNANVVTSVYMQTPNLPIRYECTSSGGSGSLEAICSTVICEGGLEFVGTKRSIPTTTGVAITSGATQQLLAIRNQNNAYLHAPVYPSAASVSCSSTGGGIWYILINPTVTGTFTPTAVANSAIEYDVSRTTVTNLGTILVSGVFSSQASKDYTSIVEQLSLGVTLVGVRDELVLAITSTTAGSNTFWGSVSWNEPN